MEKKAAYLELCELKYKFIFSERNWNMWIPGFGAEELRPYKKASTTEAHKQVGTQDSAACKSPAF